MITKRECQGCGNKYSTKPEVTEPHCPRCGNDKLQFKVEN